MTDRSHRDLPSEVTSLVGRSEELETAARLLARGRLVTVVGPAGVGKSRLALRAAAEAAPGFADGARLVDCSLVTDAALLGHTLVAALRLTDSNFQGPTAVLAERLGRRRQLLVLDGCEQLADSCALLCAELLASAPGLRLLVTSRQPLGLPGELLLPLAPLPADGPRSAGVALFAERAAAVRPGFRLTPANQGEVAALCRRLDGIPLALELAAVQLRTLTVEQLSERLGDRFRLLADGGGTGDCDSAPPRHRTLRTAVGWSHELCPPKQRLLWARISVFAGSFDLDAAEYVCAGTGLAADEVRGLLDGLVTKSVLLRTEGAPGDPHSVGYRMLDTLREYGLGWLRRSGEAAVLQRRHRDWFLGVACWGELEWFSPRQLETGGRTQRCYANLRAALEYCTTTPGEEQYALVLAGTLWYYWVGCGHLGEGRHWLDRALDRAPEPTDPRAKALWVVGYVSTLQGDLDHAEKALGECRAQALATGDELAYAYAVHRQGCAALFQDDLPRAVELFGEALLYYEKLGELNSNVLMAMYELAVALLSSGEQRQGEALLERFRGVCERHGEQWAYTYGLFTLAYMQWHDTGGDVDAARATVVEAIRVNHLFRDLTGIVLGLEMLALLTTEVGPGGGPGDLREARLLQGAADTLWQSMGYPLLNSDYLLANHAECEARVLAGLPRDEADEWFRRGAELDLEAAVHRALSGSEHSRREERTAPRLP